jgi:hypothetical protein
LAAFTQIEVHLTGSGIAKFGIALFSHHSGKLGLDDRIA